MTSATRKRPTRQAKDLQPQAIRAPIANKSIAEILLSSSEAERNHDWEHCVRNAGPSVDLEGHTPPGLYIRTSSRDGLGLGGAA